MSTRAAIIEDILMRRGATLDQLRVMRACKARPRIGFIVLGASDGTETTGLIGYLERLDRRRFEARLYSVFAPSGKLARRAVPRPRPTCSCQKAFLRRSHGCVVKIWTLHSFAPI